MQAPPSVFVAADVDAVRRLLGDAYGPAAGSRPIRDRLSAMATTLRAAHGEHDRAALPTLRCWHPRLVGEPTAQIFAATITSDDAELAIAREHGFAEFSAVEALGDATTEHVFEAAVDAMLSGEIETLRALLRDDPSLVHRRSRFGHAATLLHYAGSNGVETVRQIVPSNLPAVIGELLDAGADPDSVAPIYGGSTPLALLSSSAHPNEAGVRDAAIAALSRTPQ